MVDLSITLQQSFPVPPMPFNELLEWAVINNFVITIVPISKPVPGVAFHVQYLDRAWAQYTFSLEQLKGLKIDMQSILQSMISKCIVSVMEHQNGEGDHCDNG